jgi:hypothetical protein
MATQQDSQFENGADARRRRRWLLGLEPIFEGGWLHRGKFAGSWDVEDELIAISVLGDVTIDLTNTNSAPPEISIDAFAIGRDVDVLVAQGTHVGLTGRPNNDRLNNAALVPRPVTFAPFDGSYRAAGSTPIADFVPIVVS